MKGLDGIQGPIYVGTGCVFRRHALYGYDAPTVTKAPSKACNCWPIPCCMCCGSKRKCLKAKKKQEKQKKVKCRDASKQIHALEVIGELISLLTSFLYLYIFHPTYLWRLIRFSQKKELTKKLHLWYPKRNLRRDLASHVHFCLQHCKRVVKVDALTCSKILMIASMS
jgi:hypothetical protein